MSVLTTFALGVAVNLAYEVGKYSFNSTRLKITPQVTKEIEKAFELALGDWAVNSGVKDKRRKFLRGILQDNILTNPININVKEELSKEAQEFLNKFTVRLCENQVAYNFLKKINDEHQFRKICSYFNSVSNEQEKLKRLSKGQHETLEDSYLELNDYLEKTKSSIALRQIDLDRTVTNTQEQIKDIAYLDSDVFDLDHVVKNENRVVLLGDAGTGKSVAMEQLFLSFSNSLGHIPILKKLRDYTPTDSLDNFLPKFFKDYEHQELLIILLDGLDEIEPQYFNTALRQLHKFSKSYPDLKIVISSRRNFYELPTNGVDGTLQDFTPYLINGLTPKDCKKYYERKYTKTDASDFVEAIFYNNLFDLASRPFFLELLSEEYFEHKKLQTNRSSLYKNFVEKRFDFDQNHYATTIDLRSKKNEILGTLELLALAMECLGRNTLPEEDLLVFLSSEEYKDLKYSTVFNKTGVDEYTWQFEHNNIQEYLAAKALSRLDISQVLDLISSHNNLLPSWYNTLTFLFSILDENGELFTDLLAWIIKNEREILVKFEVDKVSVPLKTSIFQAILEYYKKHDVWSSSNKFNNRELAEFGNVYENLEYLISEIDNDLNTDTVRLNALDVLEHFDLAKNNGRVQKLFLDQLIQNQGDTRYVKRIISASVELGYFQEDFVDMVMELVGSRDSVQICSAMYRLIRKSNTANKYIDYIIRGWQIVDGSIKNEDYTAGYMTDSYSLSETSKLLSNLDALTKIIDYISRNTNFSFSHSSSGVVEAIIENSISLHEHDISIFDVILRWYTSECIRFNNRYNSNLIQSFFHSTNTIEKVLLIFINQDIKSNKNKWTCVANLVNDSLIDIIIESCLTSKITQEDAQEIYREMVWFGNTSNSLFRDEIDSIKGYNIYVHTPFDWEAYNRKKAQESFDLLFDLVAFKAEILEVFEKEGKDEICNQDLTSYNPQDGKDEEPPEVVVSFLRNFYGSNNVVTKIDVNNWFKKLDNLEWYCLSSIKNYIENRKEIEISMTQKPWLLKQCLQKAKTIDFKNGIIVNKDKRSFAYSNSYVSTIFSLSLFLNAEHSKTILLDMLSLDDFREFDDHKTFKYVLNHVTKDIIIDRAERNLTDGIEFFRVIKTHVVFLLENNVSKSFPLILKEIVNQGQESHNHSDILDIYFEITKDVKGLKSIIEESDTYIKWQILNKLKLVGEREFVVEYLNQYVLKIDNEEEKFKVAKLLVEYEEENGYKLFLSSLRKVADIDLSGANRCITNLKSSNSIDFLFDLLNYCYLKGIDDNFGLNRSGILNTLHDIALKSEIDYGVIRKKMKGFREGNNDKYEDVKYLVKYEERLDHEYILNNAKVYNVSETKRLLAKILPN